MSTRTVIGAVLALLTSGVAAAATNKVDICHHDDTGAVFIINVAVKAVPAHVANHGDYVVPTFYADADQDGFGDATSAERACVVPESFVADSSDCDDANAAVYPGAPDACDWIADNDCDGAVDPSESDDDGDGLSECGGDCNDADPSVYAGNVETCGNGLDDDCDGLADEHCSSCAPYEGTTCYWMENHTGEYCWVPATWAPTFELCRLYDSCSPGGGGISGGCYKWADCSVCEAVPW